MPKPVKHPKYLAWLAEQPCCVSGRHPVHAHHLTRLTPSNRITRNDRYAVPLSPELHQGTYGVHNMGATGFEASYGVDLTALAEYYWSEWNDQSAA